MGFQLDPSALQAAQRNLEILGNNIANANTVGFKGASFNDIIASALSPVGNNVRRVDSIQNFTQGNITATSNPLDMAINGNSLFRLESKTTNSNTTNTNTNSGEVVYSRNGQFSVDSEGYVVNMAGDRLTGYQKASDVDLVPIKIPTTNESTPTKNVDLKLTLDSRVDPIDVDFNSIDPKTYNHSTVTKVYNDNGDQYDLKTFYTKKDTSTWAVNSQLVDSLAIPSKIYPAENSISLNFSSGALVIDGDPNMTFNDPYGSTDFNSPNFNLNFAGTSQYSGSFAAESNRQDGFGKGDVVSYKVAPNGVITTEYSNGNSVKVAQVALIRFDNLNGLIATGGNKWKESASFSVGWDGSPVPFSGKWEKSPNMIDSTSSNADLKFGSIEGSATEDSNIDLTTEMMKLISAQRAFQSAAEVSKKKDEILQNIVNLSR